MTGRCFGNDLIINDALWGRDLGGELKFCRFYFVVLFGARLGHKIILMLKRGKFEHFWSGFAPFL